MTVADTLETVQSNWAIVLTFVSIIWWARMIDSRVESLDDRMDRHEARIQAQEESNHDVAVTIARQQETLNAILQRLDHIHEDMKYIRESRK